MRYYTALAPILYHTHGLRAQFIIFHYKIRPEVHQLWSKGASKISRQILRIKKLNLSEMRIPTLRFISDFSLGSVDRILLNQPVKTINKSFETRMQQFCFK